MSSSRPLSNSKEIEALLDTWHDFGARIVRGKGKSNTIKVYAPNGRDVITVHTTMNSNALKLTQADGRRAGLPAFPGDPHIKERTMSTTTETPTIELPKYILDSGGAVGDRRLGEIRGAIDVVNKQGKPIEILNIHNVLRAYDRPFPTSALASRSIGHTLNRLGYVPIAQRKNGAGFTFTWKLDDERDLSKRQTLPYTYFQHAEDVEIEPEAVTEAESIAAEEPEVEGGASTGYGPNGPDEVDDLIEAVNSAADQGMSADQAQTAELEAARNRIAELEGEADDWTKEIERLETELALVNGRHQAASEEREAAKEYAERLRESHERLRQERDTLRQVADDSQREAARANALVEQPGEWWDFDLARVAQTRDGYSIDEVIADAGTFGLRIRIQATRA